MSIHAQFKWRQHGDLGVSCVAVSPNNLSIFSGGTKDKTVLIHDSQTWVWLIDFKQENFHFVSFFQSLVDSFPEETFGCEKQADGYYHLCSYRPLSEKYCWQNPNKALRICQHFCFASRFKTSCFEVRFLNISWRDITNTFCYLIINLFVEFFFCGF